jgi:hypothetical protein
MHNKPLFVVRVLVWRSDWAVLFFFENEAGNTVTVNGVRYRNMIMEFLWPELEGRDMEDMWYQQDGATCHTARETTELLREKKNLLAVSSHAMANRIRHRCLAI